MSNIGRYVVLMSLILITWLWPMVVCARSVTIEHERYEYDRETKTYTYSQPRVIFDNTTISSRQLIYREDEEKFYFSGNVFIQSPGAILTAQNAVYDNATAQAVLKNATLYDKVNDVFVVADQIDKVTDDKYLIFRGSLTKCDMDKKAWELQGAEITYMVDQYAYSLHTALFFYDVPLFYSPYFSWPTRDSRSTGFLMPIFESFSTSDMSRYYGGRIKVPYFIALDQDHDITLMADIIQRRGVGLDVDYRYAFLPGMSGQVRAWYLNETMKDRDLTDTNEILGTLDPSTDSFDLRPTRYRYSIDHKQNIFWGGQLFFHQRANSDNEVNQEFFGAALGLDTYFTQTLDLIFPWSGGNLSIDYTTEEYFIYKSVYDKSTDGDSRLNKHPAVTVTHSFNRVFDTPVSASLTGNITRYDRRLGWDSDYQQVSLSLSAPFSIDFLNILPTFQSGYYYHNATFQPDIDESAIAPDSFGWRIDQKSLELNFEAFRLFYNDENVATNKLSLQPVLSYVQVDDVDQTELTTYVLGTPVNSQKTVSFQLNTNYLSKDLGTSAVRQVASVSLEQIFNLNMLEDNVNHQPSSLETSSGNPRLPLRLSFSLSPNSSFTASLFYRYDYESESVVETKASVSANSPEGHTFSLSYIDNPTLYYTPDNVYNPSARLFTVTHHHVLSDVLALDISATWDQNRNIFASGILERQLVSANIGLEARHSCYYFSAGYSEVITSEVLDKMIWLSVEIPLTLPGFSDTSVPSGPTFKQSFSVPSD